MTELLEATMLVCFGISWPINLAKNIKAKTAKSTSIQFILLIIFGYLAGISAKMINGKFNYVFVVYLINLAIVSVNLVVYFINKKNDEKAALLQKNETADKAIAQIVSDTEISAKTATRIKEYSGMNITNENKNIAFLGSDLLSRIPISEYKNQFRINEDLYNRSISGMTLIEAIATLDQTIVPVRPVKVFVNLGYEEALSPDFNEAEFLKNYEWLLYSIHCKTGATIYTVSLCSEDPRIKQLNDGISKVAERYGCDYIDISDIADSDDIGTDLVSRLKLFIRTEPLDFADAMRMN